jgi:hypothetical protein
VALLGGFPWPAAITSSTHSSSSTAHPARHTSSTHSGRTHHQHIRAAHIINTFATEHIINTFGCIINTFGHTSPTRSGANHQHNLNNHHINTFKRAHSCPQLVDKQLKVDFKFRIWNKLGKIGD